MNRRGQGYEADKHPTCGMECGAAAAPATTLFLLFLTRGRMHTIGRLFFLFCCWKIVRKDEKKKKVHHQLLKIPNFVCDFLVSSDTFQSLYL